MGSPAQERDVRDVLVAITEQRARERFANIVGIGPLLWREIGRGALGSVGTRMVNAIPFGGQQLALPGRMFAEEAADRDGPIDAFLQDEGWRAFVGRFLSGRIRAATEAEREFAYVFIGFEIAGEPLTVVELGDVRLVFFFNERRKVHWIDLQRGRDAQTAIEGAWGRANEPQVGFTRLELHETAQQFEQNITASAIADWFRTAGAITERVLAASPTAFSGRLRVTLRPDAPGSCEVMAGSNAPRALIEQLSAELRPVEPPRTQRDVLHFDIPFRVRAASTVSPAPEEQAPSSAVSASASSTPEEHAPTTTPVTTGPTERPTTRRQRRRRRTPH